MATFQLAGIPNFGVNNMNAPGAGVPGSVRYASDNPGLTILQGLSGVAQIDQQAKQEQALQQYQQGLGTALANNDRARMKQLYAEYPQFFEQTQKGLGLVDTDRNKAIGEAAMELRLASQQGPEAMQAALQKNATALGYLGATPDTLFTSWQKNPQQFEKTADLIQLHASPDTFFTERGQQEERQIKRDALADTSARGWAGLNQAARIHADDMEMKKLNYQNQLLENQYKATDNDLKRQELQQKIDANNQKMEEAKEKKRVVALEDYNRLDAVTEGYQRMIDLAERIGKGSLNRAVGVYGALPNVPGFGAADVTADIETLKSQVGLQTLSAMKELSANGASGLGNASNLEYEGLRSSLSSLDRSQSPEQFRESLKRIINHAEKGKQRLTSTFRQTYPDFQRPEKQKGTDRQQAPSAALQALQSNPALAEQFKAKYGYLPQGFK